MRERKPNRLAGYDYSGNGSYFITICVKDRRCVLSEIVGADDPGGPRVSLASHGAIVEQNLSVMREIYPNVRLDNYVIMPNHLHILLTIQHEETAGEGAPRSSPPTSTLSNYVTALKKFTNKAYGENIWQRSFHDHIIRSEDDYLSRWQYIEENPKKWVMGKDEYYA